MSEIWKRARKKPLLIKYREVRGGRQGDKELIHTREGTLIAIRGRDFVIRGVEGELYPITKTTFTKTYDALPDCPDGFDPETNCTEKCPSWHCW